MMTEKMSRAEFIKSKQNAGKRNILQINLTEEESDKIALEARKLGVTRAVYAKSILFYSDTPQS